MKKEVIIFLLVISLLMGSVILVDSAYAVACTASTCGTTCSGGSCPFALVSRSDTSLDTGTEACRSSSSALPPCFGNLKEDRSGIFYPTTKTCSWINTAASNPTNIIYQAECRAECTPATCSSLSRQCGSWGDNCGGTLNCGTCTSPATCDASGKCVCANECTTSGSRRCRSGTTNIIETCRADYDADSCLEWDAGTSSGTCDVGTVCTCLYGKKCDSASGSAQCVWDSGVQVCGNNIPQLPETCDQPSTTQTQCSTGINAVYGSGTATCKAPGTTGECTWNLANCCLKETDSAFCTRLNKNCGGVTANDNCGVSRTVNCGTATSTTCNSPQVCTNNVCVTPLKADGAACSASSECLNNNCIGPNWHCAPADKECYFFSTYNGILTVDIGYPPDGQNVCWSKCSPGSCTQAVNYPTCSSDKPYCTSAPVSNYLCRKVGTSGLWTSSCPGTTPTCDIPTGNCKCTSTSCPSTPLPGYYCDANGACQPKTCTPNSYGSTCSGDSRNKCNSAGTGWVAEACSSGYGCENGICVQACSTLHSGAFCTNSPSGSYASYTDSYCSGASSCIGCTSGVKCGSAGSEGCAVLVNGACGSTVNSCTSGSFSDVTDTSTEFKWNCLGSPVGCGTSASCSLASCSASNCGGCTNLGSTACRNAGCDWDGFVNSATYNKCISATANCGTYCNPLTTSGCTINPDIKQACCQVSGGTGETMVGIIEF